MEEEWWGPYRCWLCQSLTTLAICPEDHGMSEDAVWRTGVNQGDIEGSALSRPHPKSRLRSLAHPIEPHQLPLWPEGATN